MVVSSNPEDRRALKLGIAKAEKMGADIVVVVKTDGGYQLMTGNQFRFEQYGFEQV